MSFLGDAGLTASPLSPGVCFSSGDYIYCDVSESSPFTSDFRKLNGIGFRDIVLHLRTLVQINMSAVEQPDICEIFHGECVVKQLNYMVLQRSLDSMFSDNPVW